MSGVHLLSSEFQANGSGSTNKQKRCALLGEGRSIFALALLEVRLPLPALSFAQDLWLLVHHDLRGFTPLRAVMDVVAGLIANQNGLGLPE